MNIQLVWVFFVIYKTIYMYMLMKYAFVMLLGLLKLHGAFDISENTFLRCLVPLVSFSGTPYTLVCQELLRRLQSMNSSAVTSSSHTAKSPELTDEYRSDFLQDQKPYNGHLKDIETKYLSSGGNNRSKEEILKYSRQRVSCFWWFPTINLKLGSTRLVVPTGKMLLASLLLIIYYLTRKKQAVLKR